MKKIALKTLGCKVNQFESASFMTDFKNAGCQLVPFSHEADIYVINTCTVTAKAAQQSRQFIRKALRTNPDARIIVTGCYSQMAPSAVMDILDTRGLIVGNGYKHLLVETALKIEEYPELTMLMGRISNQKKICDLPVQNFPGRTRCYAKVQDGCNNFCTYCIVPYTRGPSRSLEIDKIMRQVAAFEKEGYRELVLTGINTGKYGHDLNEGHNIYTLLDTICIRFPEIRVRLSSIEPTEVNDLLLDVITKHDNFMPHLHIPLQSGDDEILRRMYRHYTAKQFQEIILRIHKAIPDIAIGCDVLTGFPGETQAQAENTYQLLSDLPVSYLHVFPYSKRPGTLAESFGNHISQEIKKDRIKLLHKLGNQLKQSFYQNHLGAKCKVLIERRDNTTKLLTGFSENYIPLAVEGPTSLIHTVATVTFTKIDGTNPHGVLVKREA